MHIFKTTRTAFQRAWLPPNPQPGKGNKSRKLPQKISNLHSSRESYPFQRAFVAEPRAPNFTANHPKKATTTIIGFLQNPNSRKREKETKKKRASNRNDCPFCPASVRSTCVLTAPFKETPICFVSYFTTLRFAFLSRQTLPIGSFTSQQHPTIFRQIFIGSNSIITFKRHNHFSIIRNHFVPRQRRRLLCCTRFKETDRTAAHNVRYLRFE